jgi:hypothetical protein
MNLIGDDAQPVKQRGGFIEQPQEGSVLLHDNYIVTSTT